MDEEELAKIATYAMWQSVDSTAIKQANWEIDFLGSSQSGTMNVQFHNGYEYAYPNVPMTVFEEFLSSSSKGRFLNQVIKPSYG